MNSYVLLISWEICFFLESAELLWVKINHTNNQSYSWMWINANLQMLVYWKLYIFWFASTLQTYFDSGTTQCKLHFSSKVNLINLSAKLQKPACDLLLCLWCTHTVSICKHFGTNQLYFKGCIQWISIPACHKLLSVLSAFCLLPVQNELNLN